MDSQFDRCFAKRSHSVQFTFDPDFKKFKRAYKSETGDRPLLLLMCSDRMFADVMGLQLPALIQQDYDGVFDCFFAVAEEQPETKSMFKTKEVHPFMPTLMIVDKNADVVKTKEIPELRDHTGWYSKKHKSGLFFDENFLKEAKTFLDDFVNENYHHSYLSESATNEGLTRVREVSGD